MHRFSEMGEESCAGKYLRTGIKGASQPELRAAVQDAVAAINRTLASYETIKNFAILPADFSEAAGELTPSLKVKREVVKSRYGHIVDALYEKATS